MNKQQHSSLVASSLARFSPRCSGGMKHVSSMIEVWVHICLFTLLLASPQQLGCHGLLQTYPTVRCSLSSLSRWVTENRLSQRNGSSALDHSRIARSALEKAGGISYRQSVCTPDEMNAMTEELSLLMKGSLTKERSSIAQNRLGATLVRDQSSETIRILEGGSIFKLVQRLADSQQKNSGQRKIELAGEIPVEVRLYEQVGASMAWHRDDILYDPPQLELVFTVENNSDCVTMWKLENNISGEDIKSQETHPNSSLLLLAGGPEHCVTSLKRGRRVILKCAYVYEGAKYIGEEGYYQFGSSKGKGSAKKGSKSKKRRRTTKR